MDADSAERFQKHVSDYDYIRFSLCDIQGRSICKLFPARNAAAFLEEGVEIVDSEYSRFSPGSVFPPRYLFSCECLSSVMVSLFL